MGDLQDPKTELRKRTIFQAIFSGDIPWYPKFQWINLWLCQQFAIENDRRNSGFPKMVIFYSFLYVYQRVPSIFRQSNMHFGGTMTMVYRIFRQNLQNPHGDGSK